MMPTIPVGVSDSDFGSIYAAARQLRPPCSRSSLCETVRVHGFLQELAEPGPGDVDRAIRAALQGIWDPPVRTGAQTRPIKPRLVAR